MASLPLIAYLKRVVPNVLDGSLEDFEKSLENADNFVRLLP